MSVSIKPDLAGAAGGGGASAVHLQAPDLVWREGDEARIEGWEEDTGSGVASFADEGGEDPFNNWTHDEEVDGAIDRLITEFVAHFCEPAARPVHHDAESCFICLEPLNAESNAITIKQCKHVFHEACLHAWVTRRKTCPACRVPMFN